MTPGEPEDRELSELLGQLRAEPDPESNADFAAALHRRLVATGPPPPVGLRDQLGQWLRERPWLVGTLSGGVAGVAAFMLMSALQTDPGAHIQAGAQAGVQAGVQSGASGDAVAVASADDVAPAAQPVAAEPECEPAPALARAEVFVVPAGQVAMVQLQFAVEREVDEAEFSVLLPDGLAFFSEGEALPERAFHWVAPLAAGDNEIPVAIVAQRPGLHRVTATATIDGEVVVHEVVLEVPESV